MFFWPDCENEINLSVGPTGKCNLRYSLLLEIIMEGRKDVAIILKLTKKTMVLLAIKDIAARFRF